jgi:DNA-binding GntR family transcriptional regulator
VHTTLLSLIFTGELAPGCNIAEAELSTRLGISRTPLREALLLLEQEGLLESRPRRGFSVTHLSANVVGEVYPILGVLESLALRSSDPAAAQGAADELDELNEAMLAAEHPEEAERADDLWHQRLLRDCENARLLAMIESTKRLAHRYEALFAHEAWDLTASAEQHRDIASALRGGRVTEAAARLEDNWQRGLAVLTQWLTSRESGSARQDMA